MNRQAQIATTFYQEESTERADCPHCFKPTVAQWPDLNIVSCCIHFVGLVAGKGGEPVAFYHWTEPA